MRALLLVAIAACSGGYKSTEECRTEANALGALLVEAAKEAPGFVQLADDVRVVSRTDLPVVRDLGTAPSVTLTPAVLKFADNPQADFETLTQRAREAFVKIEDDIASGRLPAKWVPQPRLVYVIIDPATPWERVVGALKALADGGLTAPAFVFEQPSTLKVPPRSSIDAKLDALLKSDPANRATELAQLTSHVIRSCEALRKDFGAVASVEGEDKAMTLAMGIPDALVACKCHVNIPELRSVMFRIIHVARPVRVIRFDPDAAKQPIELPANATWAEASKRFTPTMTNAELSVYRPR